MSTDTESPTQRLQQIASRWPWSAWDYHRISRWRSFDESYWTSVLALGIFVAASYLDILLLWARGSTPLPVIGGLGEPSESCALLLALLVLNGWILDRVLVARIPSGLREVPWLRVARSLAMAIPLLGLAIFPLWKRLFRSPPTWAFLSRPKTTLRLEGDLPAHFGLSYFRLRVDIWLKTWTQRPTAQIPWLIACQITPLFSGLYLISQQRALGVAAYLILHITGTCAAFAHVALRTPKIQMTDGRALAFRLLPLAFLVPAPFSSVVVLLWLPASEEMKEDRGVVETLYRTGMARRYGLADLRAPRWEEITGAREHRRYLADAAKIGLLALESTAISWLMASVGIPLLDLERLSSSWVGFTSLLFSSSIPGIVLVLAGAVGRMTRWPRLAPFVNHPSGGSLTLVPLVFMFGIFGGLIIAEGEAKALAAFLVLTAILGVLIGILSYMWLYARYLLFHAPERPLGGWVLFVVSFALLRLFSPFLAQPPILLVLVTVSTLASPLVGFAIAVRWLAPLRLTDLRGRRLPGHLRKLLALMALTAVLPLGGLALPWWGEMRRRHGSEIDRWAAWLRESET